VCWWFQLQPSWLMGWLAQQLGATVSLAVLFPGTMAAVFTVLYVMSHGDTFAVDPAD
jgi:hypothetical protein